MNMQSQLTGRLARTLSFSLSTVELRGVSAEFDQSIKTLPASLAQPVRVPTDTKGRGDFLKQLAAKSAAKLAAGGAALILVLLSTESAQAQSSDVSLRTLDGVKSIEVLPDGTAEVTLENGAVMRLPAGSFTVSGSEVLVSEAVALQMTEAAAAGGGVSGGTLAAVGGGLALAGAAGGGGGGGGSSDGGGSGSTTAPTTGTVVDGYLVNATVFQDLNGNAIFDAGEPNTTTDAQGNYSITLDPSNPTAKIVSIGGTDSSTGQAFTGTLTAPAGSTVITPLTTLVQSLVEASADSDTPLTAAEANEQLAAALGLGSDTNLLELDPVEEIENASDPSDAAAFAAAAQVAAVISAAAATQDDAQGSSDASEAVAASLAQQLLDAAAGSGDPDPSAVLSDADAIAEALEEAEVESDEASAIANGVQALNENIDEAVANADPGDLDGLQNEIVANQEVAQGTLVDLVESGDIVTTDPADLADEADAIVPLQPVVASEDFLGTYGPSNLDSAPVVSGTGRPGSLVRVTFSDGDDATVDVSRTTTVDGAGNWLLTFVAADFPTASGAYTVEVAAAPLGSSVFTVPAVSGGSFDVDLTPPAAPVVDTVSSDDALELEERESDLTVSGTAEVGATVSVTIGGVILTDTAAADGSFSVTFDASDIPADDFTISADAADSLGNTSPAADRGVTVEPEANLDPTIDPVSGTLGSAELASGLTVTGTGRAGSTITVSIDGEDQSATVGGGGTWSATFAEADLPDSSGDYSVSAVATLPPTSFTSGPVDGGGFSVDLTAPDAPSIDTVAGDNALELEEQGADLTITGTAEAGATVEVTVNGVVETVVADAGGAFSVTFDTADVPSADFSVSATATDPLGNESSAATQPVTVEPVSALTPTITPVSGTFGPTELAAGLVVSGTGRAGSTVTVDIDGVTQDATVDGDGNWTTTFAEADLPDATGDYSVSATATLAGTSFSSGSVSGGGFSVDLDAAAAPVLDAVAGNNAIELEESGSALTVTGTTDEGATVEVTIGGVTLTDVAGLGGVFSVTFDAADVPTSDFSISAVASDDLGNASASATQAISVEPVSALTPTVDPVSGVLGADDLAAGLTVTGTGRAGSTVTVTIDAEDQEAVVDGDGNWSVTFAEADLPATTGDYAVSAVATLPPTAFTSGSVDGGGFSVDVTAPDAPVIDSVAGDNALDLEEQGGDLTIIGTAEAFASVEVEINGVVETTVADDGGVFSVTFAAADVPDADFSVSATATDAAGNTGDEATQAVTVEPISTLTPTITPVSGTFGPTELAAGLVVSGMGRLGSTVTVTIDGQDQQAVVDPDGSWSVTFAEADLPDSSGDYSVSAVATLPPTSLSSGSVDGGGFSVDVTAPDAPLLDAVAGDNFIDPSEQADDLVISGTAEAFSTVTVTIGADSEQATADVNGDFSVTFAAADVPTSNFQVTAVAVDALGNTSVATDRSVLVGAVGQTITGTNGDDELSGTPGDDTINPEGNDGEAGGLDIINGSLGDDEIDLSTSGGTSFVELNYAALDGPIDVTLDYANNTGSVDKGADGTDTLISPETPGEAFGIGLVGTQGDDTFTVVQDGVETWAGIFYEGGDDTVNVTLDTGIVRVNAVTKDPADEDVTADLTTGDITFASGSIDLNVTGSGGQIELETGDGDDSVTGSDADERFILGAGTDTLDAGGGFDTVRYDRSVVTDGVTVNLQTGVATGIWDGQAFTHNLSNVERVRGSRTGDDMLTAADTGSRLEGRGGDDTLIGGDGDDLLIGGDGADTFFVGRGNDTIQDYQGDAIDTIELDPAYTEAEIDAAVAAAVQDGDAVVVTFASTGATLRLEGWTVAELQAENAGGGSDIIGTFGDDVLDGTAGDDFIDPQGNDDGFDLINASTGDDEIDFSNSGGESFVELNYSVLDGPITASIDYANNTGFVDKGADGFDSLTNPNTTGESLGIGLVGTAGNDTYNITQGTGFSWVGLVYAGGNDVINASLNEGIVRVDTSGEATTADLSSGLISFASGSIQLNATGSGGRIELRTFDEDDSITGSDADERFILGAGTDTLDGGAGFDTVRYDRGDVTTGVTVNLATGIATGLWDGQAFEHSLSNVEAVRGSRTGDDTLTAADTDAFLDGRGGNDMITGGAGEDILIGGEGDDTLQGNAGEDLFIVGRGNDIIRDFESGIDDIELDNAATDDEIALAVQNAEQIGDDVRITLPDGATILFEGWTVANFQQEYADRFAVNPIIGTDGPDVIDGTDGNDFINPLSSGDGDDVINGSLGDDEFDLSNADSESFVELRYDGLSGPIEAFIDYANNNGAVNKFGDGFDTIISPLTPGEAFGLGISSTSGDDTINITQGSGFSWFGAFYAGGNDTINANLNSGIIRIDTGGGATTANLDTGDITFAGGSIDLNVTGSGGRIELRTFDEDDNVTGSDRDERFILGAGTDVLDAAGGYDVVRYDRSDVTTGVTVNLATGIATGTWDGQAFTHTLSNVEEVRGSRTGDDTLTAADTGSVLEGRGGVDTYTGGASEDIFIVGEGHDVVYDFDIDVDQLQTRDGAFDFGLPAYEDVTFDGQPSLRFNFSPDDSVTLVGWSGRDLENSIAEELLSLTPGRMNNPAALTITGAGNLALIASDITEFLQTQSSTEFTFFEVGAAENYALSVTGSGLSLSGTPGNEVLSGTVDAATLTLDGSPVWSLTDLGIPFTDFAAMLDSATNEGAIDYSLGIGDRDLIVVADDAAQDIRIEGVDHWIEGGGGDDAVTFNGGGNAAIIVGGGDDTVDIAGSTPAEDRAFIYIDPADSGTNVINGFRFTDSEDSGDRIVVEEDLAVFSIAWEVDDATDQGDLDSIAATFDPIGPGEYALFFDQSGNAVLQDLIEGGAPGANYTLGDTIASFTNADVSGLSGSNVGGYNLDGFLVYSEIDLPPASELV